MALTKISTGMLKQDAASSDLNIDAGTLYIDVSNNRVGIANTSPNQALDVTGNVVISGTATATTFVGSGASLTSIPNSALTNSSITINSTATSLGESITLGTDDVAEGSSNLYYTNARADARIAAASTDDLSEGSTNLYYTDARADARVALIVDSAPSTLNTLNELAAALGDDANFSTTVTNSIAAKLPLAGGTMTGPINAGSQNISAINNATAVSFLSTNGYWVGGTQRINGSGDLVNIGTISSGVLTVNGGSTNVVANFVSTDSISGIKLEDNNGNVELSASGSTFRIQPSGGASTFEIESNGTAHFKGGILKLGTADSSSGHLNAYELMSFNIDSDNDDTNRHFAWYKNGESASGTEMMKLDEDNLLSLSGTALVENAKLKAIAESNTDTAVDVFVYDTRKDSDGGAWRKRTQNTSWYNETLNTSTRGSRREFPCVAVIVAETTQLTIYDGDDPSIPMWMVFNRTGSVGSNGNIIQDQYNHQPMPVVALDASIVVGGSFTVKINFASDISYLWADGSGDWIYKAGISKRNAGLGFTNLDNGNRIINAIINDVAMTVLPNAPIDADTGLPVPTIAVATNGGVSVIKDDGSVVDVTAGAGSAYNGVSFIDIDDNHNLIFEQDTQGRALMYIPIPSADRTSETDSGARTDKRMLNTSSTATGANAIPRFNGSNATIAIAGTGDDQYVYGGTGVTSYAFGGSKLQSSVAYITSDYNTGHMVGDIKLATLSDTDTTNAASTDLLGGIGNFTDANDWTVPSGWSLSSNVATGSAVTAYLLPASNGILTAGKKYAVTVTQSSYTSGTVYMYMGTGAPSNVYYSNLPSTVGTFTYILTAYNSNFGIYGANYTGVIDNVTISLAEEDRSYNDNGLQVFGTITKTAVATGAELVGYSGFSSSNYLQQPYNADLNFGSGSYSVMGWFKTDATNSTGIIAQLGPSDVDENLCVFVSPSNYGIYFDYGVGNQYSYLSSADDRALITNTEWHHFVCHVSAGGRPKIYVDGIDKTLTVVANAPSTFTFDTDYVLNIGNGRGTDANLPFGGSIALLRISATAPSEEQIKKMYNDEKHLFATNAKATLYGSSDAVTALAYDDDTELLHAGTSAGRSVFQGLNRVDNTTDAVGAAISASNGFIVEE